LSRLGEPLSPRRDFKQRATPKFERILAQAKLFRLDESDSRTSETSSPRRDLAQQRGWISGIFAQARAARLSEIIRIPICFHMQTTQYMPNSQFTTHNCSHSSINTQFMQF